MQKDNRSKSYFSVSAWDEYRKNFGFTEKLCSGLFAIYGFKFSPEITDDCTRESHEKRQAFVFSIPRSYTPQTLPRSPKPSGKVNSRSPVPLDEDLSQGDYETFLLHEHETDPDFFITFEEYCAYQKVVQHEKEEDPNFSMSYKDYSAYCTLIETLPELQIKPKEYMSYSAAQRKMKIALSYQHYLDKMGLREELKVHFRKRNHPIAYSVEFASLKQELIDLIDEYQGKERGFKGGLLGQYLALHEKIAELDKKLIGYAVTRSSLYQLQEENQNSLSTITPSLTRPCYIISENFRHWQELGDVEALDLLPIEDQLKIKEKKKKALSKTTEKLPTLSEDLIQKIKEFIKVEYLNFNLEIFLLGLCGDQVQYLRKFLGAEVDNSSEYSIKGYKPIKMGGREWVLTLTPITHLHFNITRPQDPPIFPPVQHSVPDVFQRLQKRTETYQQVINDYEDRTIESQKEINKIISEVDRKRESQRALLAKLRENLVSETKLSELQEDLKSRIMTSVKLEEEQQRVINVLNEIFSPQESLAEMPDLSSYFESEPTPVWPNLSKQLFDLIQLLRFKKTCKGFNGQEKINFGFVIEMLEEIPSIFKMSEQLKKKESEIAQRQTEIKNTHWLNYFYSHLQGMPRERQQRLKVSVEAVLDASQFDKTQADILDFINAAYKDLYQDITGSEAARDASIRLKKFNDNNIGILIDLEDLKNFKR